MISAKRKSQVCKSTSAGRYRHEALSFEDVIRREQCRTDRNGKSFVVVVFESAQMSSGKRRDRELERRIIEQVRSVDIVGSLERGRICVLLPSTTGQGGELFARRVIEGYEQAGLVASYAVRRYPGELGSPQPRKESHRSRADSREALA